MRVHWKWVIKSIPSLAFGLLMFFSTGTPRQPISNVGAWLIHFGVEDVPPWLANNAIDTWLFWIGLVGFCVWAMYLYGRPNLRSGKLSVIVREGEPWVQIDPQRDPLQPTHPGGQLYTYRIALINSADSTLRNVEVKLTSLEKTPKDFDAIGSHLKLSRDQGGATNFNVHPTKDPQFMDAVFVDVFKFFVGPEGTSSLSVSSLPEDSHGHMPVDTYDVKVMATSESGEMAIAEMVFIPRPDQLPDFRLLKMQSFPGALRSPS